MNKYWSVKGSIAAVVIGLFLEVILPVLIFLDKRLSATKSNKNHKTRRKFRHGSFASKTENTYHKSKRIKISGADSDKCKPRKLSAAELDERFPPYEFDNVGYFPPVSMRVSASPLVEISVNAIGSAQSLQTQSTVVTKASAGPKYSNRTSLESLV